jgi:hypothetical protein
VAELADAVVRLTMSHVVLPTEPPEIVAGRLARLVARYLGDVRSRGRSTKGADFGDRDERCSVRGTGTPATEPLDR